MPQTLYSKSSVFIWYGAEVEAKCVATAVAVTRQITRAAAQYAEGHHDLWENDTYETQNSVFWSEPRVDPVGPTVHGYWGAHGAALFLEFGTVKMAARPWLRPAADATYKMAAFAGALSKAFPRTSSIPSDLYVNPPVL
jgi:hypothetical protein